MPLIWRPSPVLCHAERLNPCRSYLSFISFSSLVSSCVSSMCCIAKEGPYLVIYVGNILPRGLLLFQIKRDTFYDVFNLSSLCLKSEDIKSPLPSCHARRLAFIFL